MDENKIIRNKCRCCSQDIIYDNTDIKINKFKKIRILGKSYLTTKNIDGIQYNLSVCQPCLLKYFPDTNVPVNIFNIMCDQTKFAFNIPDEVYTRSRKKYAMTLQHMIEKYGKEEGERIWKNYCEKQSRTNTFEYKREKHGWTKEQFIKYNSSRAVTLNNLIKRHGKEEGERIWKNYCEKQSRTKSWAYMVEKYGEKKALEINRAKSQSLEAYIKRYGKEKGTDLYMDKVEKVRNYYSKISQDFFNELDKIISKKFTTYYATKNKEYGVNLKDSYVFLDYFIKELNLCVEFNGTNFHADPRVYDKNSHPNPFNLNKTANDIWKEEEQRIKKLKEVKNIDTIVVWEIDYKKGIDIEYFIKSVLKIEL